MAIAAEGRLTPRVPLRVPCAITRQHGNRCEAVAQDISLDGLSILGAVEFFRGERLRIVLSLPMECAIGGTRLDLICLVRYMVEIMYPSRKLRVGLKYEHLSKHARRHIMNYMTVTLPPTKYHHPQGEGSIEAR